MNQAHIHLLITHLPIFGSVLGAVVLIYGMLTKSNSTKIAAYMLFILSAIGGGIAYLTGEGAEELVENIPGISENVIEEHEESAGFALASVIVLGVASIGAWFLTARKSPLIKTVAAVVLVLSLISFGLVARTGYLGGQIRHTEVSNATAPADGAGAQNGEEEDDD